MDTKNFFKKPNTLFLEIPKSKIFVGLFLGVFFALTFYILLQLFRKIIIVFDALLHNYELFLITEEANQFYNFLFAFIAVFFAFTMVFVYLLDSAKSFLSEKNYKIKAIINQQRLTNWFFLSWFSRIGYLIGLLALDYEGYNIYSENKYILILFVVVFFGQIWMSIRWFTKGNKFKWFVVVLLITLSLSFGLSHINVLNNELIDKSILSKNVLYKNNVHVVKSKMSTEITHRSLILNIVIPNKTNKVKLIVDGKEIELKDFEKGVFEYWKSISKAEKPFVRYVLFVDKNLKVKIIDDIKQRLIKIGGRRLYYATKDNLKTPFYYKSYQGLGIHLNDYIPFNKASKEVAISILENGRYFFNGKTLFKVDLVKEIKRYFNREGIKALRIYRNKNITFYQYFQVLESSKEAINQLRNEFSQKGYATDYINLNNSQIKFIKEKYPWHIIDEFE
jgi:biopolymer transport protein ExbD